MTIFFEIKIMNEYDFSTFRVSEWAFSNEPTLTGPTLENPGYSSQLCIWAIPA